MDRSGEMVLIVDDDGARANALSAAFQGCGYFVAIAATGQDALDLAAMDNPGAVVLDPGLGDMDAVEVCRRIRRWSRAPIIFLADDGAIEAKVLALDNGADDYLTRPFSMPELLARVRVALRHSRALGSTVVDAIVEAGNLRVDPARHLVTQSGRRLELTPKEFDLLALLARNQGKVLTHRAILRHVWGPHAEGRSEYLRTYVNLLRKKLGDDPASPRLVTEPSIGYRLGEAEEEDGRDSSRVTLAGGADGQS